MYILPVISENKFNPSLENARRMVSEVVKFKRNQRVLLKV